MLYEQAQAHWLFAQHSPNVSERQTHAERAMELFTQTESAYDRRLVEEFLSKPNEGFKNS
jgi:hypothetical protein